MAFIETYSEDFCAIKRKYSSLELHLQEKISTSDIAKIEIYKKNELQTVENVELTSSNAALSETSPENSAQVILKRGKYALIYKSGALAERQTGSLNKHVRCSAIETNLRFYESSIDVDNIEKTFAEKTKNYFSEVFTVVDISKKTNVCFWVNDSNENVTGKLELEICKIIPSEKQERVLSSMMKKTDLKYFSLDDSYLYNFKIFKIEKGDKIAPTPKYPNGTYQIVQCKKVAEDIKKEKVLERAKADKASLSFDKEGRLSSLAGISISDDVDPLKHYVMLGKAHCLVYLDYNTDEFLVKPDDYAEVFMSLVAPTTKIEELEKTDEYAVYSYTDYAVLSYNFRNIAAVQKNILSWIKCKQEDIHKDEYGLYFYIDNFELNEWQLSKFKKIEDENFVYVNLDKIKAFAVDDVSSPEMKKELACTISSCSWKLVEPTNLARSYVDWNYDSVWMPMKKKDKASLNKVQLTVIGKCALRISKRHFFNATGIDLDKISSGNLSDEQFRMLNLNMPKISSYTRLQHFLGVELT